MPGLAPGIFVWSPKRRPLFPPPARSEASRRWGGWPGEAGSGGGRYGRRRRRSSPADLKELSSPSGHDTRDEADAELMVLKRHTIEVDEATATLLRERADAQGISVAELVAGLTALTEAPAELSPEELAELDRQMAAIDSGEEATFPHEEVASWLETWGTPDFKPFLKNG